MPGELVAVTPHGLRRKKFWDFDPSRQIRYARAGEYAEHLRELVVRAVRRRARSSHPVAVMVSGGLDSSGIYCVLRQLQETGNAPPMVGLNLVYPGFEEANEERYIGELERAAGREIVRLPAPSGFMNAPQQAVWHAEAPPTPMGYRMPQCIAAGARRQNARVVLNGTFGDQVLGSPYYLVDLAIGLRWRTLFRHLQNVQRWAMDVRAGYFRQFALAATARAITPRWMYPMIRMLRELSPNHPKRPRWFAPGFRARSARRARWQAPLSGDFASHHAHAQFQNTVWPIYMRALELGNKAMAAGGVEESSPFWDRDLVEFLMAVPGEVVNLDGIPKWLYREAMRGILPESIRLRRDKGDFTRIVNSEARSELRAIRESLGRNCLGVTMGYLDPAALAGALDPDHPQYADRSTSDPARRAAALIGLELWLEVFFGRSRSEVAQPPQAAALSLAE